MLAKGTGVLRIFRPMVGKKTPPPRFKLAERFRRWREACRSPPDKHRLLLPSRSYEVPSCILANNLGITPPPPITGASSVLKLRIGGRVEKGEASSCVVSLPDMFKGNRLLDGLGETMLGKRIQLHQGGSQTWKIRSSMLFPLAPVK
ncbi:UNVERIFIED_CONTAM: hypothetical protein K2H54_015453 [Gekko kuhli]